MRESAAEEAIDRRTYIGLERRWSREHRKGYAETLLYNLRFLYKYQPVMRADIEHLEGQLRIAIADEQLRNQLLEQAVSAAEKIVEEDWTEEPSAQGPTLHERLSAEIREIRTLCESNQAEAVVERLDKLRSQLETSSAKNLYEYAHAAQQAISATHSLVRKSELVQASTVHLGVTALRALKSSALTSRNEFQCLLSLSLHSLANKNLSPEQLAEAALEGWGPFTVALEHYQPFDPRLPPDKQMPLPAPPDGYADWFSVGQSQAAHADADLRKRYEEVFVLRIEQMQNSGRAQELAKLYEQNIRDMKAIMRAAYAGNRDRGAAAIVQHISVQKAREELIECLHPAVINRDRLDELDRRHDQDNRQEYPSSHKKPKPGEPQLTVESPDGTIVVRGAKEEGALDLVEELAQAFAAQDSQQAKIDVADDGFAGFARFCDEDLPYHAVIVTHELTGYDRQCESQRHSDDNSWQKQEFPLGQRRVLIVVNKANPVDSINFAYIARAFGPDGPGIRWQDVGGTGDENPRAYGPAAESGTSLFLRHTCLHRMREVQKDSFKKVKLPLREDLVVCESSRAIIERVSADPLGIGFLAWNEELTPADYERVKVLAVGKRNKSGIEAPLDATIVSGYPLEQSVYLYTNKYSPETAQKFAKFAAGPDSAALAKKLGLARLPAKNVKHRPAGEVREH